MKRIGLFGGTFNPIHLGHLRAAEEVCHSFELHRVFFIPSSYPPHKKKEGILDAASRAEMVRRAIADNPCFAFSEVELERPGKSYSIQTIEHFRHQFGPGTQVYFIVGLDAFLEVSTWKEYGALFRLCHFVVVTRPGFEKIFSREHLPVELTNEFCYDIDKGGYAHKSGFCVYPAEVTGMDISSTRIRQWIREGRSIKYLVPPAVETFILSKKLYQNKDVDAAG
jgi:nicotinate-nucleotide adenylyltransferase